MTIGNEKYYMIMQYKPMSVIMIHLKIFTTVAMIYFTEIQGRGSTHYHVLSIVSEKLVQSKIIANWYFKLQDSKISGNTHFNTLCKNQVYEIRALVCYHQMDMVGESLIESDWTETHESVNDGVKSIRYVTIDAFSYLCLKMLQAIQKKVVVTSTA